MSHFIRHQGIEEIRHNLIKVIVEAQSVSTSTFRIVLSGGSMIDILNFDEFHSNPLFNYENWKVFLADERYVSIFKDEKDESTWSLFRKKMSNTPLFMKSFFLPPIPSIDIDIDTCCNVYDLIIGNDSFNLVLLGLGPDGHTASLFPPFSVISKNSIIPILSSPKPPPKRISMSIDRLNNSQKIVLIALGSSKAEVVKKIIKECDESFPPTHLKDVEFWLDEDSGRLLNK